MVKFLAVLWVVFLGGCADMLAKQMVSPPNGGHVRKLPAEGLVEGFREVRVKVGPPEATLAVWIGEPGVGKELKGTIILVHGFLDRHTQVQRLAKSLSVAGYRTVLVDLRGHGDSTGERLTFGVQDARDLSALTDWLQSHGLCGKTVGVFGASYGAGTALMFAGSDPRVTAVVAVAQFANLRTEAPHFGKTIFPLPGFFLSDADYTYIVNRMGVLAGFNPDACSPVDAIKRTAARVRIFHGNRDSIIPVQASERLAAAAPDRTELTIVPGQGHLGLCFDLAGDLWTPTREWFDSNLLNEGTQALRQ